MWSVDNMLNAIESYRIQPQETFVASFARKAQEISSKKANVAILTLLVLFELVNKYWDWVR